MNLVGLGVFFLVLATAVFFFLRRATYATIVLRVSESDALDSSWGLPMWYLDNLKPGIEQKDIFGRQIISVVRNFSYLNNSNNRIVFLTLRLLTTYDKKSGTYTFEGVPLLVGSYQNLKIKDILLRGVVYRVENSDWQPEIKTYLIEGVLDPRITTNQDPYMADTTSDGIHNYLANKFVPGLKIVDSESREIVEIIEAKKEMAHRKFVYNNRIIEVPDNERQKVKLKIKVLTEKNGDVFLYRNEFPVKINENINLSFWDFEVMMTITDIKEFESTVK